MLGLDSILVFSENPKKLGEFYSKVLDEKPGWTEGEYVGFKVGTSFIMVGPHDKVHGMNRTPERILINFSTKDVEKEFKRIEKLGAKVIAKPYHPKEDDKMMLATFADPDGNYFQLGGK